MQKRRIKLVVIAMLGVLVMAGCGTNQADGKGTANSTQEDTTQAGTYEGTQISLSDEGVLVDGETASTDSSSAVYTGEDIIYYKEGQDETYGEGTTQEEHSEEEAAMHTVVTITQAGTYVVSGSLSYGQIAVDLGKGAKKDEDAVVNLVLNNTDITCTVASAVLVYRVYECGDDDVDTATKDVDTSQAGFNLILADDSENTINGSHVAKIYEEGTTAEDVAEGNAKKAHKYDGAIESRMSFNIEGGTLGNGKLTVNADNEGIETKLHMTINGGEITVNANDDSLNAGEDGVSVITINDGIITCDSGYGAGEEGDGIDSNGWIVINGGYTIACANAKSPDSGVDSDMGIYINGGTLLASGHMYDEVSPDSEQNFIVLSFVENVEEKEIILLSDTQQNAVAAFSAVNDYTTAVYSSPELEEGDYCLYKVSSVTGSLKGSIYTEITDYADAVSLQYSSNRAGDMGQRGFGGERRQRPEGAELPEGEGMEPPEGMKERPEGMEPPEGMKELPEGEGMQRPADAATTEREASTIFTLSAQNYQFGSITETAN